MSTAGAWWTTFFDDDYLRIWRPFLTDERSDAQAEALWSLLELAPGKRVLDAPCGYGRLSHRLARRGAAVTGVDASQRMIDEASAIESATFLCRDLREPTSPSIEGEFDAAFNVFSSIGYGTEEDDVRVLTTIRGALRPGGRFVLETRHRDSLVSELARGHSAVARLDDGTLVYEQPRFDPVTGRVDTVWHWAGPKGTGSKPASFRLYAITELRALLERCGFTVRSLHEGLATKIFEGGRHVALLATAP